MKEKYIKIRNLSVSEKLFRFVNEELLPKTKIKKENFWNGFDKYVHGLSPKNKKLLKIREKLQKKIDAWHKEKKGKKINIKKYIKFGGPALVNYNICTNSTDFLSLENLKKTNNENCFSFKDEDVLIYGFEVRSIYNLILR